MCDDNIEIGVTEITNNILVSANQTDQLIDINVTEITDDVTLNITPSVVEVNIDVTQNLVTQEVTIDTNTCVNIIDVKVTDATDNVTLNITPSIVEVNINRISGGGGGSSTWGGITGTLSNQTDLVAALNAKQDTLGYVPVPSSRTLTINGTTFDLSANRSWTVAGGLSGTGTTNFLPKWGSSTSLTNSIIFDNGTDLSIGSTNPLYRLTVQPSANINFGVGRASLNSTNDSIFVNAVDNVYNPTPLLFNGSHLGFYIGFSEALRIDPSKNVLIGTSSGVTGGGLLQVNGDVNISGGFKVNGVAISSGSGISGLTTNYITKATSSTTIGNSLIFDNGTSVGIGTASPQARLDISGNDVNRSGLVVYNANTANGDKQIQIFVGGQTAFGVSAWQNSGVIESVAGLNSNFVLSNYQVGPIIFQNAGRLERMRIASTGALLVGKTSTFSNEKLAITGSTNIWGVAQIENNVNQADVNHGILNLVNTRSTYAVGNDASIMFSAFNSTGSMHPRATIGMKVSSDLGGELVFNTRNNSGSGERMRIKETGIINFANVPTSSSGLSSGDIYKSAGVLMIV
jgi:hypothetical protein